MPSRERLAVIKQLSSALICAGILVPLMFGSVAYAADTTVNVTVNGSTTPALELDDGTPSGPVVANRSMFAIRARISALTQVQVYVDGAYAATVPVTPDQTSFSYDLTLNSGTHIVTLVGISAYADTNETVTFSVDYTPPSPASSPSATPPATKGQSAAQAVPSSGVILGETPLPAVARPSWTNLPGIDHLYQALVFTDIVNPYRPNDTPVMLLRCGLSVIGLISIVFPRLILTLYRRVCYAMRGLRKHPLPVVLRHYPLWVIRVFGIVIFVAILVL